MLQRGVGVDGGEARNVWWVKGSEFGEAVDEGMSGEVAVVGFNISGGG